MSGSSGLIDTSGSTPSLRLGALATTILGTITYGWAIGVNRVIAAVGGGISSTIDGVAEFRNDMIRDYFGLAETFGAAVARENGEFLAQFGIAAQFLAFLEGIIIAVVLYYGVQWMIVKAQEAI